MRRNSDRAGSEIIQDREYELKFKARFGDLERFVQAVEAVADGIAWNRAELANSYFDTKDHALSKRGVSVRLRLSGGKALQTVKTASRAEGGLMDRDEWEYPVAGAALDWHVLPAEAKRALGNIAPNRLRCVIEVETERRTALIERQGPLGPGLKVEVAVDQAVVKAGGKSEHFAECELELKQGDVVSFFNLAAEIHGHCPLLMSATSKGKRGYRLLHGWTPTACKLPKFELRARQTIDEALGKIFSACIGNILANEDVCLDGADPEGVHQMRVSVRRLRSALKVFQPFISPGNVKWLRDELKWLGSSLGPARDWDVFITETLEAMTSYGIDGDAISALRQRAEDMRQAAYGHVHDTLGGERYAKLIFRLTAFVALEGWLASPAESKDPLYQTLGKAAPDILRQPYAKLLKTGRKLEKQNAEARHKVRVQLKNLRYAVDFMRRVFDDKDAPEFLDKVHNLQDKFGHLNDVAQAEKLTHELITEMEAAGAQADDRVLIAAGQVQGWHARALHEIEPDLIGQWNRFVKTTPFWERKS